MSNKYPRLLLINVALTVVTGYVLFRVAAASLYTFAPPSFWFIWHEVASVYVKYPADKDILMVVDFEVKRPRPMFFVDKLYCRDDGSNGEFHKAHTQSNGSVELEPVSRRSFWFILEYHSHGDTLRECYVDSEISAFMRNGSRKTQKIKSEIFWIGAEKKNTLTEE